MEANSVLRTAQQGRPHHVVNPLASDCLCRSSFEHFQSIIRYDDSFWAMEGLPRYCFAFCLQTESWVVQTRARFSSLLSLLWQR